MPTNFDNLPDPYKTDAPAVDPNVTPPGIKAGESAPGSGVSDRLAYIGNRIGAGITTEAQSQATPRAQWPGLIPYLSGTPITNERSQFGGMLAATPMDTSAPLPKPPDRWTEAFGSGAESMVHHPILSAMTPGITFATGATNELLKDLPPQVREGVGAAIGLVGPFGVAHLASNVAHLAQGHFGGIGTMLHSIIKAPASSTAFNAANALVRVAKSFIGEGLGSETPLSRAERPPTPQPTTQKDTPPATPPPEPASTGVADALYHWGGFAHWPSAADMVNSLTSR
jgi:hypothetical protein